MRPSEPAFLFQSLNNAIIHQFLGLEATNFFVAGAKQTEESMSGCLQSEQAARESIAKQWAQFIAVDRSRCINTKGYLPSYVEWLTCLEMERDVRNLRREPTPGAPKR